MRSRLTGAYVIWVRYPLALPLEPPRGWAVLLLADAALLAVGL